jgi:hypothetical protein
MHVELGRSDHPLCKARQFTSPLRDVVFAWP